ncbi:Rrf2 family transcriptional regulator [Lacrimispora sp.]|uniref:Rrf2 family transcriptional regulator n=1 Tax=Lacrimispora sp. TaxID=2719234 RepID=UPI0039966757
MFSTKLSVSIHILCMLALNNGNPITSDWIAGSIGTNPALVRRLMGKLKKADLIKVQTKLGATGLNKPSDEISLLEVFLAVEENHRIFDMHTNTNEHCFVGANIGRSLTGVYDKLQDTFEKQLAEVRLSEIVSRLNEK